MQLTATFLALFASQALSVNIWSHPNAEAECGTLGAMKWDLDTLKDYKIADLRKCKNHPLSESLRTRNEREELNVLRKRKCVSSSSGTYGCSDGWCWSRCGQVWNRGEWCWLAKNNGTGDWKSCSNANGCRGSDLTCGKGSCKQCGCSC